MNIIETSSSALPWANTLSSPLGADERYNAEEISESMIRDQRDRLLQSPIFIQSNRRSRKVSICSYGQLINAKQKVGSTARKERKDFTTARAAVIEQWISFVPGIVGRVCGAFGAFCKTWNPISGSIAWLESVFMATLGLTALLCLLLGR